MGFVVNVCRRIYRTVVIVVAEAGVALETATELIADVLPVVWFTFPEGIEIKFGVFPEVEGMNGKISPATVGASNEGRTSTLLERTIEISVATKFDNSSRWSTAEK